jgi:hypothetical protein
VEYQDSDIPHPVRGTIRLGFGVGTLYQTIISGLSKVNPGFVARLASTISRPKRRVEGGFLDPIYPKTYELLESSEKPLGWMDFSF